MTSWLTRQRKQALIDLGEVAGLHLDDDMRKEELVQALDQHLQQNATSLHRNASFEPYYGTRQQTPGRPSRKSMAAGLDSDEPEVKSVVRGRGRRATQVKSEPKDESSDILPTPQDLLANATTSPTMPAAHTPTTSIIQRRRSSLPPSPRFVADEVEHATANFYAGIGDLYTLSGIPEMADLMRERCSTLVAVHLTCLLIEGYGLGSEVLPWKYAFDIPASRFTSSFAVSIPDLFVLLSSSFWAPTLLWSMTSLFVPLGFAYFYNLTVHNVKRNNTRVKVVRYDYDPFLYNITKAVATNLVYGSQVLDGIVSEETVARVVGSQFGGFQGIMINCVICGLAALWEAANR